MKRKGLMRRVLASILCASLVFQNVSVTAYATEANVEAVTEVSTEETSEEISDEAESSETAESSEQAASDSADSEESSAAEVVSEEAVEPVENTGTEAVETEASTTEAETKEEISSETAEAAGTEVTSETTTDEDVVSQDNATAEVLEAEIVVNEDLLRNYANQYYYVDGDLSGDENSEEYKYQYKLSYDSNDKVVTVEYSDKLNNPFNDNKLYDYYSFKGLVDYIKSTDIISVEVDEKESTNSNTTLKQQLTYKWQSKNAEGNFADMPEGAVPVNVGEYKLVISLDESLAKAESKEINFKIEKGILTVNTGDFKASPASGTTVKEIKEQIKEALYLTQAKYTLENGESLKCDVDKYIKTLNIIVRKSSETAENALKDEDVLLKGNDYSVDITAELNDGLSANFELKQAGVINLKITELKPTALTIETKVVENEKDITRVYTGKEVEAPIATGETPEIKVEVREIVGTDSETGEDVLAEEPLAVEYEKLTKTWYDANDTELEADPVDAGVYYYEITYTDEAGIYEEASARVKVVVEAADIVIVPALSATEYYVGMTANDVLANVSYTLKNADGTDFAGEFDADTFWGVSYNNPDLPQSYAPVFELQMGEEETVKNEEGKDEKQIEWSTVTDIEYATGAVVDEKTISYRLVFSGKKALFENGFVVTGTAIDINATDVNSGEKNYKVKATEDKVDVTVKANVNAEIKIDAIPVEGLVADTTTLTDGEKNKIYTKVYDGACLYADREAYKKAVVQAEGVTDPVAKDIASELTYEWYRFSIDNKELDKDGNKIYKPVLGSRIDASYWTNYNTNPWQAGLYALKISYKDPANVYSAQPVTIYFAIEKQLVKVIPDADLEVYAGTTVSDFLAESSNYSYKVYQIPNNKLDCAPEELVEMPELGSETYWATDDDDRLYNTGWYVKAGDNTDPEKAEFYQVGSGDKFKLGVLYKYGLNLTFKKGIYPNNYSDNYEVIADEISTVKYANKESETKYTCEDKKVTVKPMGDIELDFIIDPTKLTETEKVYDGKPFDLTEAIANGLVTVIKKNTDEVVPTTGEGAIELEYQWYNAKGNATSEPVHAGDYVLKVRYAGCDTYKVTDWKYISDFKIEQREITVTPYVNETILAGLNMDNAEDKALVIDDAKVEIKGFIEEDAAAFAVTNSIKDVPAFKLSNSDYESLPLDDYYYFYSPEAYVTYDNDDYYSYLRTDKKYGVTYKTNYEDWYYEDGYHYLEDWGNYDSLEVVNNTVLYDKNVNNYKVVVTPVEFEPKKRGNSNVCATSYSGIYTTALNTVYYDDYTATITPIEGIPYCYDATNFDEDKESGNYFVFKIEKPSEFYAHNEFYNIIDKSVYKNSIENAGGIVLNESHSSITVAFDAAAPESGENIRKFDIIWETLNGVNYTESFTVDFTNAHLEDDLRTAVVPKSLKFNGVNSKMIVGEGQQLDVKITKNLIDDVICLNYEVLDGQDVVTVDSAGYVTALKPGKATVAVYPIKKDKKGNETRLDFKAVTTKITVTDVTAPKVGKVYPYDQTVEIQYTKPSDGYRREIYILEGKGLKPADFEAKIAEMNQNNFEGIMVIGVDEISNYDSKKNIVTTTVGGLKPVTDYTIYLRNVSAMRTNAEDGFVELSAKGNVKSFKTSKVQVENINLFFDKEQKVESKNGYYNVLLSEKKVKISAKGQYEYMYENDAADYTDGVWYDLPIAKDKQATYENPKLTYYALYGTYGNEKKEGRYTLKIGERYYIPSTIAKIDKKGNIKLSGVGKVYIRAYDSLSKKWSDTEVLNVQAGISKVSAKKITAKVGEPIDIQDYITFHDSKNKKIKLEKYHGFGINVKVINGEGIELNGDEITATMSNQTVTLNVALAGSPEINTDVTVKTKAMTPVKKLKASNIMDSSAKITFTHSISYGDFADDEFAYKIEIRDKRNALVREELIDIWDLDYDYIKSNPAKRVFIYSYNVYGLVRKSDYKISVTPVYGTETAKAATTKVKTTEMPAWSGALLDKDDWDTGMPVYYSGYEKDQVYDYYYNTEQFINYGYYTSGKSYTFLAGADKPADGRPTDTLTWKSSNSKVATIKANPGTYSATFNAIKPGMTFIEVSSKLRKGVIARYAVYVKAVGSAGDGEFGDYELWWDPYYEGKVEVLTEANPVRVVADPYDYSWVKFEAPADGDYTFTMPGVLFYDYDEDSYYGEEYNKHDYYYSKSDSELKGLEWDEYFEWDEDGENIVGCHVDATITLEKGQIIYLRGNGSFTMTVEGNHYANLTTTNTVNSKDANTIIFTAPEDNYYTFNATSAGKNARFWINDVSQYESRYNEDYGYYYDDYDYDLSDGKSENCSFALNKGDKVKIVLNNTNSSYDVSVTRRKPSVITSTTPVEIKDIKKGDAVWYAYTAELTGNYTFKSTDATEKIEAVYYDSIMSATGTSFVHGEKEVVGETEVDNTKNVKYSKDLVKGQTVLIKVYTNSETAATAKLSVTLPTGVEAKLGETSVTVANDGETWVSFVVDEDNAKYNFKVTTTEANTAVNEVTYYKDGVSEVYPNNNHIYLNEGNYYFKEKGTVVYIKIKAKNATKDATSANVKVIITKATATEITLDAAKDLTVENGGVYYYTFTAPSYGLYVFKSDVTANAEGDTHSLVADRYKAVSDLSATTPSWATNSGYDFYKEIKLVAGEQVVFAVRTTGGDKFNKEGKPATTTAKISVSKVEATDLPSEITLAKESAGDVVGWYKFTAMADDTYTIKHEYKDGEKYVPGLNDLANVQCSAALQESNYMTSAYDGKSLNLSKGDTIYFRVVSNNTSKDNAANIKISVVGAASTVTEIPESAFEVPTDETKTYKFTVKKAGRYAVNFSNDIEGVTTYVERFSDYNSGSMGTNTSSFEFTCKNIGQTYYFSVWTSNANPEKTPKVTLSVKEVVPTELTNGAATATFNKKKGTQWYSYTVPATGRYIFTATKTVGEKTETAYLSYYNDIFATEDYNYSDDDTVASEEWFTKSEVIYIKVVNNDSDNDVRYNISVKAVEAKDIAANTKTDVSLKKNESAWYKFTADADTYYSFKLEEAEGMLSDYSYYLTGEDDPDYDSAVYLKAGQTMLVKVERYDSSDAETLTAKLTINKETVLELKEGEALEITTTSGGLQYVSFTPSKTADYAFYIKEIADGITGINTNLSDLDEYYVVRPCNIATEMPFYVGAEFETETGNENATKSFKLCVEEVIPTQLTADTAVEAKVVKYQKAWFTFKAPEKARYVFTAEDDAVAVKGEYYYDGIKDGIEEAGYNTFNGSKEVVLSKNQEVAIAVYYNSASNADATTVPAEAAIDVKVSKVVPKEITAEETSVEIKPNSSVWYSYKAAKNGTYTFITENATYSVYKSMVNETKVYSPYLIDAGETVYVKLTNNYSEKKTAKLTVKVDTEVTTFAKLGEAQNVEFTEDDVTNNVNTKWIAFKASEAGYYNFEKTSVVGYIEVYYNWNNNDYNLNSNYSNRFIGKDEIVYFRLSNYSSSKASVKITVTEGSTKFVCDTMTLSSPKLVEFETSGDYYYEFTAPSAGYYKFFSTSVEGSKKDYRYVYLYNSSMSSSISAYANPNFEMEHYLDAGERVYLRIYGSEGYSKNINVVPVK